MRVAIDARGHSQNQLIELHELLEDVPGKRPFIVCRMTIISQINFIKMFFSMALA